MRHYPISLYTCMLFKGYPNHPSYDQDFPLSLNLYNIMLKLYDCRNCEDWVCLWRMWVTFFNYQNLYKSIPVGWLSSHIRIYIHAGWKRKFNSCWTDMDNCRIFQTAYARHLLKARLYQLDSQWWPWSYQVKLMTESIKAYLQDCRLH